MDLILKRDRVHGLCWPMLLVCLQAFAAQSQTHQKITQLDYKQSAPGTGAIIKYTEEIDGDSSPWRVRLYTYPEHQLVCIYFYSNLAGKIKEGPFLKYYSNGQLSDSGTFSNNRKNGQYKEWFDNGQAKSVYQYSFDVPIHTCTSWYQNGSIQHQINADENGNGIRTDYYPNGTIQATGKMRNGQQHQLWHYYKKNGKPLLDVSFLEGDALNTICYNEKGQVSKNDCAVSSEPVFPGGNTAWVQFIHSNLTYPEEVKAKKISGMAICLFDIDTKGMLHNIEVVYSPDPLLSKALINTIKASPRWAPARFLGEPTSYTMRQEISFTQSK